MVKSVSDLIKKVFFFSLSQILKENYTPKHARQLKKKTTQSRFDYLNARNHNWAHIQNTFIQSFCSFPYYNTSTVINYYYYVERKKQKEKRKNETEIENKKVIHALCQSGNS